jgi:hypothetical protein
LNERYYSIQLLKFYTLMVYPELRVLFLIIELDELKSNDSPWSNDMDCGMDGDDDLVLEKYMAEYERGKVWPTCFRCGSREYFEVPAEQVARLGGLETVISVLERARNDRGHREDMGGFEAEEGSRSNVDSGEAEEEFWEPLRYRLMSWRDV